MFNIDKKYTNIHSRLWKIGFEIEFLLKSDYNYNFIQEKLFEITRNLEIGDDGSLHPDWRDRDASNYEIKTFPSYPVIALERINKIFILIEKYGYTNKTCSIHLNISPVSDELYYKINPFYIARQKLWVEMRKSFERSRNMYCKNYNFRRLKRKIYHIDLWRKQLHDKSPVDGSCHYKLINFDHVQIPRTKDSRIEIRSMGGELYHRKFDLILDYTDKALQVIKNGCNGREFNLVN